MMKRGRTLLGLLLCAAVMMGLMPGLKPAAKAGEFTESELWVGTGKVTAVGSNPQIIEGTGGTGKASVYASDNTIVLELDGFTYSGSGHIIDGLVAAVIYYTGTAPLTIKLKGKKGA